MSAERRYGQWAGNTSGVAENLYNCIQVVWFGMMHRQCSKRRGYGDGGMYCKQHDPNAVAARQKASGDANNARQVEGNSIQSRAIGLAKRLGVAGSAHFSTLGPFKKHGYVRKLVISFDDAERLAAELERLRPTLPGSAQ